jgi:membrane-associated protease RseP (regulator of RpoE activity)
MSAEYNPPLVRAELPDVAVAPPPPRVYYYRPPPQRTHWPSLALSVGLFFVTALSTMAAGTQFAAAYAVGQAPNFDNFFSAYLLPFSRPRLFLSGLPFALTLMGILLAHELGHYFACRHYRIYATYPFFIPAPTLIGTLGAFIRIRSAIFNRRALFDMAIAGPLAGFVIAVPTLAIAIARSKISVDATASSLLFGQPLVERLFEMMLRPGVPHSMLLLSPVGRAAWVGLFVTALNLLPAGQLDGGHILYTLISRQHRWISLGVALLLLPLALLWVGWVLWAVLIAAIAFRGHPPLIDRWQPLDRNRRIMAGVALAILLLCFMPAPFVLR